MLLVQLTAMLTSAAILGGWIHETVMDTDTYVEIVGPIGGRPEVIDAIGGWAAAEAVGAVEQRSGLDVPDEVEDQAATAASSAIDTERASGLWVDAHRSTHGALVALLRGESHPALDARDGQVELDLSPILADALPSISEAAPSLELGPVSLEAPPADAVDAALQDSGAGRVTLWRSDQLAWLQAGVRLLDRVAELLPFAAVALAVFALVVSPRRPRTARRLAISIGITAGVLLLLSLGVRYLTGTVIGEPWGTAVDPSMRALTEGLVVRAGIATAAAAAVGVLGVATGLFGTISRR